MINREVKMAGYWPGVFFLFFFFPACLWTRHSQSSPIKLNSHKVGCSIWFNFQTHLNAIHGLSSVRLIWLSSISECCINYVGLWTKMEVRFITSQKNEWGWWVIPEKNAHPPDGWGRFLTPPLTWISWSTRLPHQSGFPRQKITPPAWISGKND